MIRLDLGKYTFRHVSGSEHIFVVSHAVSGDVVMCIHWLSVIVCLIPHIGGKRESCSPFKAHSLQGCCFALISTSFLNFFSFLQYWISLRNKYKRRRKFVFSHLGTLQGTFSLPTSKKLIPGCRTLEQEFICLSEFQEAGEENTTDKLNSE